MSIQPNDKPYAPHPDRRCEKCDMIQCICTKVAAMSSDREDDGMWITRSWILRLNDEIAEGNTPEVGAMLLLALNRCGPHIPTPDEAPADRRNPMPDNLSRTRGIYSKELVKGLTASEVKQLEACPDCAGHGNINTPAKNVNRKIMCARCHGSGLVKRMNEGDYA